MNTSRTAISEAAADWFVRSQDDALSAKDREQLARWLRESPVHIEEYLAVARLWSDVSSLEDADELIADAEQISASAAVVPLHDNLRWKTTESLSHGKQLLVAAVFVICVVSTLFHDALLTGADIHETSVGEQRSVLLEDGSLVDLNTATEIEVRFTDETRLVILLAGEAFFEVTKNPARPFVVEVGHARIRVVGTSFNVYRLADSATVTVIEGNVAIALDDEAPRTQLGIADQASIDMNTNVVSTQQLSSPTRFIAWKKRRLVFEHTRLDDVMAEFARYRTLDYDIKDEDAAALELTGTFESHDVTSLIDYLKTHPGLSVSQADDRWFISGKQK